MAREPPSTRTQRAPLAHIVVPALAESDASWPRGEQTPRAPLIGVPSQARAPNAGGLANRGVAATQSEVVCLLHRQDAWSCASTPTHTTLPASGR